MISELNSAAAAAAAAAAFAGRQTNNAIHRVTALSPRVCVCVCIKSCRTIYCRVVATRCHKTPQMALEEATDWRHRMLQRARVIASVGGAATDRCSDTTAASVLWMFQCFAVPNSTGKEYDVFVIHDFTTATRSVILFVFREKMHVSVKSAEFCKICDFG